MSYPRARYLISQLISNRLTRDELNELISSIGQSEMSREYSDILENYFEGLMEERDPSKSENS